MHSSHSSLRTRQILLSTRRQRRRRSGEIQTEVDAFVSAVGTGGTATGTGSGLKEHNPNVKLIAVEPADSPVLSGGAPGPHKIQGIGAGFVPGVMDLSIVDEIIRIQNDDAFDTARKIAKTDGVLVGISAGAAL